MTLWCQTRAPLCALWGCAGSFLACGEPDVPRQPLVDPVVSTVTVSKAGNGVGTLRSLPAGVVCGVDCEGVSFDYEDKESIELIAEPSRSANFGGLVCTRGDQELSVDARGGSGVQTLTLPTIIDGVGQDWACTGTFVLVHSLQVVQTAGTGSGRVRGALSTVFGALEPLRIDCPSTDTCVAAYFDADQETLTATPDPGSVFTRWEFCAANATTPAIVLVMTADEDCRPIFDLQP